MGPWGWAGRECLWGREGAPIPRQAESWGAGPPRPGHHWQGLPSPVRSWYPWTEGTVCTLCPRGTPGRWVLAGSPRDAWTQQSPWGCHVWEDVSGPVGEGLNEGMNGEWLLDWPNPKPKPPTCPLLAARAQGAPWRGLSAESQQESKWGGWRHSSHSQGPGPPKTPGREPCPWDKSWGAVGKQGRATGSTGTPPARVGGGAGAGHMIPRTRSPAKSRQKLQARPW